MKNENDLDYDRYQIGYELWQEEESEKFWQQQNTVCRREKEIGLTCIYCEFKPKKVDLSIPF